MTVCGYVQRRPFGYWEKRFAPKPSLRDALLPVHYLNCVDRGNVRGFVRQVVHTILIDLSQDDAQLLADCKANTRNEIHRAAREGAEARVTEDPRIFLEMYAAAAAHKSLPQTSRGFLESYGGALHISEVLQDGRVLAAHVHVADPMSGRARLIRSASLFRDLDKPMQQQAGRANRFLHHQDFLYFKKLGYRSYDMGGYDPPSTDLPEELRRVSDFKASFGGRVVQEANYLSCLLHLYRQRRRLLGRLGSRRGDAAQAGM
jgi:hypothetical protein